MPSFEMKQWLDTNVVPLLAGPPAISIYHPFWNGIPPKDVLILFRTDTVGEDVEPFDPTAWPKAAKRLLDDSGFRFDYTREQMAVQVESRVFNLFGGDGAPIFNKDGMASLRLFKKMDDGIGLIAQIGCEYPAEGEMSPGEHAAAATKGFYAQFEENPLEVCRKYGAVFGQA